MSLAEIQRGLTEYLKSSGDKEISSIATNSLRGLPVYHYAYRASLIGALRDVFERTHGWLGDGMFDDAARAHIARYPPNSWTMSDYGLNFDVTLDSLFSENPEVAELAWLDWSLRVAFNGTDAGPLDMANLTEVDWDSAKLQLAPTLVIRTVRTNCAAIWGALTDNNPDPPAAMLLDQPSYLSVWRHDLMPRFHSVSDDEHIALFMAREGASFGAICRALTGNDEDGVATAERAGAMLGRWIKEGVLVSVD